MKRIAIIGAGGFGREVVEIFKADNIMGPNKWDIIGFVDDTVEMQNKVVNGIPIIGTLSGQSHSSAR